MKTSLAALALLLYATSAWAQGRADTPALAAEPAADIADVFAWMSPDAKRLNLALTVHPDAGFGAVFSTAVQYVFHVESRPSFGSSEGPTTLVICQFDPAQKVSCWVGDDAFVTGDASDIGGLTNAAETVRVFTGARTDPFVFNASGFRTVSDTISNFGPLVMADPAGCRALAPGHVQSILEQFRTAPGYGVAFDAFEGARVLALVISLDLELVASNGHVVSVWASTHRATGIP